MREMGWVIWKVEEGFREDEVRPRWSERVAGPDEGVMAVVRGVAGSASLVPCWGLRGPWVL